MYYNIINSKKGFTEFVVTIPNGPSNIYNYIFNPKYKKACQKQTTLNLKHTNRLNASVVAEINKGSVDFFPWDLMYVEANKLTNWKPRPYLQNLNMSMYFDKKTADYFKSSDSPDYLIWHPGNSTEFMMGIDNSYLLNNEINSVLEIVSNYSVFSKQNNALILKKNENHITICQKELGPTQEINNTEWIELPATDDVLACKIKYDFNFWRGLKKQFYRDDEFFIEYRTASHQKFKKRIWPKDAEEFIWLNPFIKDINDSLGFKNITHIRFSNTNKLIHKGKLKITFKTLVFGTKDANSKIALFNWFNPTITN